MRLNIVTLNLLDDNWQRQARLELALDEIKRLQPDVMFLQELSQTAGVHKALATQLPKYSLSLNGPLATLSILKPIRTELLELSQGRAAQKVVLKIGHKEIAFVNVHLYFSIMRDKPRHLQTKQILNFAGTLAVIGGDFNAPLSAGSMEEFEGHFADAYRAANSADSPWTSPTPLWRGRGIRHSLRRTGFKAASGALRGPLSGRHGAIDHILVSSKLRVSSCERAFDKPSPNDARLYASDHFGLAAVIVC